MSLSKKRITSKTASDREPRFGGSPKKRRLEPPKAAGHGKAARAMKGRS